MNFDAIKDLLYRLADDDLIIGHRNSEWTGLGPILEEDIAFSSMAQDEVGHAQAYYMILHELLEEPAPDTIAFARHSSDFRSCHLVEYPIGGYAFSLVRHMLYDTAEAVRLNALSRSSFKPLAELSNKLAREELYHQLLGGLQKDEEIGLALLRNGYYDRSVLDNIPSLWNSREAMVGTTNSAMTNRLVLRPGKDRCTKIPLLLLSLSFRFGYHGAAMTALEPVPLDPRHEHRHLSSLPREH